MADIELVTLFFEMRERPFKLLPDPELILWTRQHTAAYETLKYGLESRAPITLLTGDIGAGKTILLRKLMEEATEDLVVGLVSNVIGDKDELLHWILNGLGVRVNSDASYVTLFQSLQDVLIEHYAAGRRVVLIFDEAQNIRNSGLEELRMLTNINSGQDELVQLVLIGQPELRDAIMRPELRQFMQRVAANYHLKPLDIDDTAAYVVHLLKAGGGTGQEFRAETFSVIYHATKGVPRLINQLCDFAMVRAAAAEEYPIGRETIRNILRDGVFMTCMMTLQDDAS